MFVRRDGRASGRFLETRIALLWVGVAVWLLGLLLGRPFLTGAAIVVLVIAMILGLEARRRDRAEGRDPDGGPGEGEEEGESEDS